MDCLFRANRHDGRRRSGLQINGRVGWTFMSVGAQETEWEQNVKCIGRRAAVGDNSGEVSDKNVQGTRIADLQCDFRLGTET